MLHNIAQPDFEAMVMRLIEKNSNVDLRQGWTWISSEEVRGVGWSKLQAAHLVLTENS
jgi:hypothetical protein